MHFDLALLCLPLRIVTYALYLLAGSHDLPPFLLFCLLVLHVYVLHPAGCGIVQLQLNMLKALSVALFHALLESHCLAVLAEGVYSVSSIM